MLVKVTVENALQAKEEIEKLETEGFMKDNIYIFAHDQARTNDITQALNTEKVGIEEQGFKNSILNLISSRGDELRTKMGSLGLSDLETELFEQELDRGKLVIVASTSAL